MFLGALRLRQSVLAILFLLAASALLVSCGSNNNLNNTIGLPPQADPAKIRVHVFVSNPLFSAGARLGPGPERRRWPEGPDLTKRGSRRVDQSDPGPDGFVSK